MLFHSVYNQINSITYYKYWCYVKMRPFHIRIVLNSSLNRLSFWQNVHVTLFTDESDAIGQEDLFRYEYLLRLLLLHSFFYSFFYCCWGVYGNETESCQDTILFRILHLSYGWKHANGEFCLRDWIIGLIISFDIVEMKLTHEYNHISDNKPQRLSGPENKPIESLKL